MPSLLPKGRERASLTIRNLDEKTKRRLRLRAARHGRSMEEEVRMLLRAAVTEPSASALNLADAIRDRFRLLGGVELRLPAREPIREPPKLGRWSSSTKPDCRGSFG